MEESTDKKLTKMWPMIVIGILVILLITSFIFNLIKCDDLRGRITLGQLYNDFKGNDDSTARMTATVYISAEEGACSFDVFYEYDDYREVISNNRSLPGEEDICKKYEYPSDPDGDTESKEFLNRLLDDDYLERHV